MEKVKIIQSDSDKYQSELSAIKSSAVEHSEEMSNEKLKRQIIEKEYDKINAQLENLVQKYEIVTELEEKNQKISQEKISLAVKCVELETKCGELEENMRELENENTTLKK